MTNRMRTKVAGLGTKVWLSLLVVLAVTGCGRDLSVRYGTKAGVALRSGSALIDHRIILIGDAGWAESGDPVLSELTRVARELPSSRVSVVFLGDNAYPHGLPAPNHPTFDQVRLRLEAQVDAATESGAPSVFIPGNHDYEDGKPDVLRRQGDLIVNRSAGRAALIPSGKCPGPIVSDLGAGLRVIYVDSEWLLQGRKAHACVDNDMRAGLDDARDFYTALSEVIASAGERLVVVATHHPLATHGPHGGLIPWQSHLFPLWNVWGLEGTPWPYLLPLPVLPSLVYALPRSLGVYSRQDLASGGYSDMRQRFEAVLREHPGVIVASGHEHSLQLLRLTPASSGPLQIVSGGGTVYRRTPVGKGDDTIMASPHPGFFVLDVFEADSDSEAARAVLRAIELVADKDGQQFEVVREFEYGISGP